MGSDRMDRLKTFGSSEKGRRSNTGVSCCGLLSAIAYTVVFALFYYKQYDVPVNNVSRDADGVPFPKTDCCAFWNEGSNRPVVCG